MEQGGEGRRRGAGDRAGAGMSTWAAARGSRARCELAGGRRGVREDNLMTVTQSNLPVVNVDNFRLPGQLPSTLITAKEHNTRKVPLVEVSFDNLHKNSRSD
eukprot:502485-Hanusia_phi.AAC.2